MAMVFMRHLRGGRLEAYSREFKVTMQSSVSSVIEIKAKVVKNRKLKAHGRLKEEVNMSQEQA